MTAKEIIDLVLNRRCLTQAKIAEDLGISCTTFNRYILEDVIKSKQLFEMLDKYNFSIKIIDSLTGEEIEPSRKGRGKPVIQTVKGVVYDTRKAYPVANDFFADGEHEYSNGLAKELYRKPDGTFFFALYNEQNGSVTVAPNVPDETARKFVEKYGTDLHTDED